MSLKKLIEILLMFGVVISVGFLSMSGMLALLPLLFHHIAFNWLVGLSIASFVLSGVIEGEVYRQSFREAFKRLLYPQYLKDRILLKDLLAQEEKNYLSPELSRKMKAYQSAKTLLEDLKNAEKASHDKNGRKVSIKLAREKLKKAEDELLKEIYLSRNHPDIARLITQADKKSKVIYASWVLSASSGIGTGLATITALKTGIPMIFGLGHVVLSLASLTAIVWPLGVFAAVGYAFMMYNTISDMIENNFFGKCKKWAIKTFARKKNEGVLHYGWRIFKTGFLATLAIGLSIFATIATAGTWWFAIKKAIAFSPVIFKALNGLTTFFVAAVTASQFVFNTKNSLDSARKLSQKGDLLQPFKTLRDDAKEAMEEEHWLQIINPFRLLIKAIELPFSILFFLGHLFCIGVQTYVFPGLPTWLTAALSGGSEGFQDANFFIPHDKEHAQGKGGHHHEHDHGVDLLGLTVLVVLTPLKLLSALWEFFASKATDHPKKSYWSAVKWAYGVPFEESKEKPIRLVEPQQSFSHIKNMLTKEIERLDALSQTCQSSLEDFNVCQKRKNILNSLKNQENIHQFKLLLVSSMKDKSINDHRKKTSQLKSFLSRQVNSCFFKDDPIKEAPTATREVLNYVHRLTSAN